MKNIGTRVFAAILVIWYSLSLIGFGVHTCSENNRSFLTSFISGVSCEDVHPEELCGNACCEKVSYKHSCKCCCGHIVEVVEETAPESVPSDGCVLAQKKCCSDDYQQIEITGSGQVKVQRNVWHRSVWDIVTRHHYSQIIFYPVQMICMRV